MNRSQYLPTQIQDRISYEEKVQRARDLAKAEKDDQITEEMDKQFQGKSTDQSKNMDKQEINSWIEAQMKITAQFNKFFFGVVCPQLKAKALEKGKPMMYQHPLTKEWYLIDLVKVSDDGIYQLLKLVNPYYPKLNDLLPASTTVLSNKQLSDHIKWVERWASENGLELPYIVEEWERILQEAGIQKEHNENS